MTHSRRAGNAPSVDWGSQNHKMPAAAASSRSSRKLRSHNSLLRVTRPAFARAKRQWATTLAIAVHSFKMFQTLQTKYACARSLALSHCVPLCKDRVLLCELCVEVLAHARKVLKEANARLAAGEAFVLHAICLRASFAMHLCHAPHVRAIPTRMQTKLICQRVLPSAFASQWERWHLRR